MGTAAAFLPACGCGCHFGPSLLQDAAPKGEWNPLFVEVQSEGWNTWLVQPSALFRECFEILTDTPCTAGCYFCLVIKENTFLLWLTLIKGNKSLSSACTVANTHKPTQIPPWVSARHGFGVLVLFWLSSRGHLQKVLTSTAAVMSCLDPKICIFNFFFTNWPIARSGNSDELCVDVWASWSEFVLRSLDLPHNKCDVSHGEMDKHLDKLNKAFTRSFLDCVFIYVSSNLYLQGSWFVCLAFCRRFVELVKKTNYI